MQIRPVTAADHAAWWPLWQSYLRFYATDIPEATRDLTWQRFLAADEPMHAALAWRDDRAIGLVHWLFHRSCWTTGDYCYLQDLFVDEQVRGGGVGRRLIEHVYAQASLAGAARVHWLTHESNSTAMQLYDRIAERPGLVQYRHTLGTGARP